MSRREAIQLVKRLMDGSVTDEDEADAILDALQSGLACPHVSDYIFWDSDPEPTAEKIVDRALAYKPIAL
ncbi:e9imm peptide [Streptomyces sp. SCSIO 30461]|uniref:e9imm peptide n=1 Tax=Streptomyces sp. SCSIO 30461 TaxID=3118085 RepID=UPI0030CEFB94